MSRNRSRSNLGVSISLLSLVVLVSNCGGSEANNLFGSGAGGLGASGTSNHAGHSGASRGGASGAAGSTASKAGNGGSFASGGSAAGAGRGGAAGSGHSGSAGSSGGAAPHAGSGGNAVQGGSSGTAGEGGVSGNAGRGGSAGIAGFGGSSGSAGSGGNAGAGGNVSAGGNAGAGGNVTSGGSSGTAGSGGMGGAGGAVCFDNGACGTTEYCSKPTCTAAAGHCSPRPTTCTGTKQETVCGCDGITYHDSCLLHSNGQNGSPSSTGACAKSDSGTLTCSSDDEASCVAKGGLCGFKAALDCSIIPTVKTGVCWILPTTCPGVDDPNAHSCSSANPQSCASECTVIKSRELYTLPNTCGN